MGGGDGRREAAFLNYAHNRFLVEDLKSLKGLNYYRRYSLSVLKLILLLISFVTFDHLSYSRNFKNYHFFYNLPHQLRYLKCNL